MNNIVHIVAKKVLCNTYEPRSTAHVITKRVDWEDRTWYPWDEPTCDECILLYFAVMSNDDNTRV